MFRIDAGGTGRYCDGLNRRSFVQLGVAGMASIGLPAWLQAREQLRSAESTQSSAILIWLDGGPGHLDTYDMKPTAPAEYRGIWRPIRTNVPGIELTELFPKQAKIADKFSIVRSLHHDTGDHFAGGHRMLTSKDMGVSGGNTAGRFPSIGSIVSRQREHQPTELPHYMSVPVASSIGLRPGYFGGNWIGTQYDPFQTQGDPNSKTFRVDNLQLAPGMTVQTLDDRKRLALALDRIPRTIDNSGAFDAMNRFEKQAFSFVTAPSARTAFDLSRETDKLRDLYGRHTWGQSTLLARRLVEAGASFVTVHLGGWDHHWNLESGMESYLPRVDELVAALFNDLDQRGILDSTLVILCGEFSRTPRMNDGGNGGPPLSKGTPGRDHWGNAMFCLLGGGGIRGGQIIGSTNSRGEEPQTRPVQPTNLHATIYRCLGIDPKLQLLDHAGRPTSVLEDPTAIEELL
ncbi:MAG: DUF1501 domain-containing protein [Planctomycetaceae bacterium]|nr:DUF1501 domain-containing protein [Planctomycetaceae bacterium]